MTVPSATPPQQDATNSKILRAAIWVAIGALIAAAIVCVVMVLVGTANGIVPRAFLTILLMVAFAGVALLDTYLAPRRPVWFALTSMIVWVVTLLIGAVMIWLPFRGFESGGGAGRFLRFLLIVLILQLFVLHVRLFVKAWHRHVTTFTTVVGWITIVLVGLLAVMLVFPLMLEGFIRFHDLYWRLTVAVAILAAVGTALVPLVNALLAPRTPRAVGRGAAWPTYADGVTPLPVLADGQPDWNAYYTGQPTHAGQPGYPAQAGLPAAPYGAPQYDASHYPAPQYDPQQYGAPQYAPAPQYDAPPRWPAPEQAPAVNPETAAQWQDAAAWPAPQAEPAPQHPVSDAPQPSAAAEPDAPQPAREPDAPQSAPAAPEPDASQPSAATGYEGFPPPPPVPPHPQR
jgi:hypothetical protein